MSLIDIKNLTFCYDGSFVPVFENVNIRIDTDWKTGLVGRNGRGKTTLLKLIEGRFEYSGKISANVKFTYFPFEVKDKSLPTYEVLQNIRPDAEEWEIMRELNGLGVDADVLYRPFESLSKGEQTKALLGVLFLRNDGFLLIDEPTNHLDAEARKITAEYLRQKKGFILVSHDRAFLDGCVDHILSLNKTGAEIQSGNFTSWFTEFNNRQAFEEAQNERLKKDITRLSESAKRTADWADKVEASKSGKADSGLKKDKGHVGHMAAKMMKRALVTERRKQELIEQKSELMKDTEKSERLKLNPLVYRGERLISLKDVEVFYGGRRACPPVGLNVNRGDRIAVTGCNGSGKSSILKLIAGENLTHLGTVNIGGGLIVSYVPQSADGIGGSLSDFARENQVDETLFMTVLRKMDFTRDDLKCDISAFSEGRKKKALIARSLCQSAHMYVWDEPLNFIDIYSRMQIEKLIKEFAPTMIFVEHDREFVRSVATGTVNI